MGVGYCFIIRMGLEFARFLCTADKALEQRLSFNMLPLGLFGRNDRAKIDKIWIMQWKTRKKQRFQNYLSNFALENKKRKEKDHGISNSTHSPADRSRCGTLH